MHPATYRFPQALRLPGTFAAPQCPAHLPPAPGGITGGADDGGSGVMACGLSACAWDLAQFEPVRPSGVRHWLSSRLWGDDVPGDEGLQASAALRGQGLLAAAPSLLRGERLLAQGRTVRDILQRYAQARADARLPGEASWVAQLARGEPTILLASAQEFGPLARQALGHRPGGPIAPLPQGRGTLVNLPSFFQQGTDQPSARARRALREMFIHPRCDEMLKVVARITRHPRGQLEAALDGQVMGRPVADAPRALAAVLDRLLQGDEEGVVRALFDARARAVVANSPLLPRGLANAPATADLPADDALAADLETLVADALAHPAPRRARAQALIGVLGAAARARLVNAFARADPASLQRVLTAYAVVVCNDAVRGLLRPMVGGLDALKDLDVRLEFHASAQALGARIRGSELPARLGKGDLEVSAVSRYDPQTRMAGVSAAAHRAMGLEPDPPPPAGQGVLSRAHARAATGRPALEMHFAPGPQAASAFDARMVLFEVIAAYADGFAYGAAQGVARSLALQGTSEGLAFAMEYLSAYVGHRLTGTLLDAHHGAGVTATRRVIEARTRVDGVGFEQAEREVLGVLFRERSFGTSQDLRDLERLTRCLYEQRKLDLLRGGAGPAAAGDGTLVNVIGGSVLTSTWVRVIGRNEEAYVVQPLTSLPGTRIPGTFTFPDGSVLVDAERLVSVMLPPGNPAATPAKPASPQGREAPAATAKRARRGQSHA